MYGKNSSEVKFSHEVHVSVESMPNSVVEERKWHDYCDYHMIFKNLKLRGHHYNNETIEILRAKKKIDPVIKTSHHHEK